MKIAIAGIGCVGLSNAVLLAQNHRVVAFGIVPGESPIVADKVCSRDLYGDN